MRFTYKLLLCVFSTLCLEKGILFGATWNGGTGNWNDDANWNTPAIFPNAVDATAIFNTVEGVTANVRMNGTNIIVGTLDLSNGPWIFVSDPSGSFTLQATGNPTINLATNTHAIALNNAPGFLVGSPTVDIVPTTGNLLIETFDLEGNTRTFNIGSGGLSPELALNGVANGTLIKTGAGLLQVRNFSANLTINTGTVRGESAAIGLSGGNLSVASGATFDSNGQNPIVNGITGGGSIIVGGAQFTFGQGGGSSTFSGTFSGTTTNLRKAGAGTITLDGSDPNTFVGTTFVSAGTLVLNKSSGVVAVTGNVTLTNATTLRTDSPNQFATSSNINFGALTGSLDLNNNNQAVGSLTGSNAAASILTGAGAGGILTTNTASTTTFAGAITQNGGISKQGAGILTFSGTNTYTGGTSISGGTLRAGSAGAFPSNTNYTLTSPGVLDLNGNSLTANSVAGSGNITLGAATLTTGTASSTISGVISDSGALVKQGAGTLILTGTNTYTGGTTVTAGTLQGNSSSLQGDILNNAALVFDQTATGTYADNITTTAASGSTLVKQGSGNLILDGTATVDTTTTVNAGRLSVNGTLISAGGLTIASGGTLGGGTSAVPGQIGSLLTPTNVIANGTVSPGNSIGTLEIFGNFTQNATLEIEFGPNPPSDLLHVHGSYTIGSNVTLLLMPDPGVYPSTFTRTIVDANPNQLFGTFANVVTTLPTFRATVSYNSGAGDVIITSISTMPFSTVVIGGNAEQVAICLDSLTPAAGSDMELVIAELRQIPTIEGLAAALALLQPSQYTALALAQENATLYTNDTIFYRLLQNARSCPIPCRAKSPEVKRSKWQKLSDQRAKPAKEAETSCSEERSRAFWVTPFGGLSYQNHQNGQPGFNTRTSGITAGADFNPSKRWTAGGALGYSYIDLDWKKSRGNSHMNNAYGALYTGLTGKHAYLFGSAIGSYNHYDASRHIKIDNDAIMDINRHARSSHNGWQASGHLQSGLFFGKRMQISPFLRADYLFVHESSFTEHSAKSLNLHVQNRSSDLLDGELGIELSRCFSVATTSASPFFGISVIREWRFMGKRYHSSFQGSSCVMDTTGMKPDRTLISPEGGLTWLIPNENCTLSVDYKGKFGKKFQDHRVLAQFLFRF